MALSYDTYHGQLTKRFAIYLHSKFHGLLQSFLLNILLLFFAIARTKNVKVV